VSIYIIKLLDFGVDRLIMSINGDKNETGKVLQE